jgi:hypothetical protein
MGEEPLKEKILQIGGWSKEPPFCLMGVKLYVVTRARPL